MYIEPNTSVKILKDVPLDTTYEHTIYFGSKSAQTTYFSSKVKYNRVNYTYQRVNKGWLHVDINAENLYDCNYIMFQNASFGSKWFYAFITAIEYVNNDTSRISFILDVMQSWFFDYELGQCYVEREHTSTDNLFENTIEENITMGPDMVSNHIDYLQLNRGYYWLIASRRYANGSFEEPDGKLVDNLYVPMQVVEFEDNVSGRESLKQTIYAYVDNGYEDSIADVYYIPSGPSGQTEITPTRNTTIGGYTPKNKKLFSYPYSQLIVSNNSGDTAAYKWELFSQTATFHLDVSRLQPVTAMVYPKYYRGVGLDYDSGLTISGFPHVQFIGSLYAQYLAQHRSQIAIGVATAGLTAAAAVATGGAALPVAGALAGAAGIEGAGLATLSGMTAMGSNVANNLAAASDLKNTPPQVHGQIGTDTLNYKMQKVGFTFYAMSIRAEYARIVDNYFDKYGYACKQHKVPNRNARPHWCYTKTIGCTIKGSMPAGDEAAICRIYDNGITFWKNGSEVGNYSLDNTV